MPTHFDLQDPPGPPLVVQRPAQMQGEQPQPQVLYAHPTRHQWTREQIADHLECLEQPQASPIAPPILVPMQKEQSK